MKNFSSWLIMMVAFIFWGVRLVGTVMGSIGSDFIFEPSDMTMEVALLFITFICICFFAKRQLWASIIYLAGHFLYYGSSLITHFSQMAEGSLGLDLYIPMFLEFIGVILPIVALIDVLLDKNRKANPKDEQTDWFYKNEEFDRNMDDRADKNNYRTL